MSEKCDRCGQEGQDRRTLWMACLYDMGELGMPLTEVKLDAVRVLAPGGEPSACGATVYPLKDGRLLESGKRSFYTMRVCKGCRAAWLAAVRQWFLSAPPAEEPSPGTGIFVREDGTTVELTREEWDRRNPGRGPIVVKPQEPT